MALPAAKFELEETSFGYVDLCDPEIEYIEPPPKLVLIVNDGPVQPRNWVDHSGDGVDLAVYCGDPDQMRTLDQDLSEERTEDVEMEAQEAVLVPEAILVPVLPEPSGPLPLRAHSAAIAGHPKDRVQSYFIASFCEQELATHPELAAQVLQARHELYLMQAKPGSGADREEKREHCLGLLLGAMPQDDTPKLLASWRAGLKLLSELFDDEE